MPFLRRRFLGSGEAAEPPPPTPPELYFAAAGITDPTEKEAVTFLYTELVANGLYDRLDRLFLCSPTSSSAAQVDFISLLSLVDYGGAEYKPQGIGVDGSTIYLDSAGWKATSSTNVALAGNNAQIGYYISAGDLVDFGTGALAGCYDDPLTQILQISVTGDIGSYNAIGYNKDFLVSAADTSFVPTLILGPMVNSRTSDVYNFTQAYWYGGIESGVKTTMTGGDYPAAEAYFGCVNASGTPAQFIIDVSSTIYFATMWCGGAFDEADANQMMIIVNDYNTTLGRGVF